MTSVLVSSGSRLHFGLTRPHPDATARYAGLGVMVQFPATEVRVAGNPEGTGLVSCSERIRMFGQTWLDHLSAGNAPLKRAADLRIELLRQPPDHSGFGSGTQLAQAVAAGICRYLELPIPDVREVARILDRGRRSLVGSLGFARGGLVIDRCPEVSRSTTELPPETSGKTASPTLSLPGQWRVVVVLHRGVCRTWGARESRAFGQLQPDSQVARQLEDLIEQNIGPAAAAADFDSFSAHVHEYGRLSGNYYAALQGGPYNGPHISNVINFLRECDIGGVGQSSWGPAVFAWCRDQDQSARICQQLTQKFGEQVELLETAVRNRPASIDCE